MRVRLTLTHLALVCAASAATGLAQGDEPQTAEGKAPEPARGLLLHKPEATPGFRLLTPVRSRTIHLVDEVGDVAHTWEAKVGPGGAAYMLENGNLLRCGRVPNDTVFDGGSIGGHLQEIDWDSNVVWEFVLADGKRTAHHDVAILPNGNVLIIAWEYKSPEQARGKGRAPEVIVENGFWPGMVLEIERASPSGGDVVWEWHAWDHLIQDVDDSLQGYGSIPERPGLIDINADHRDRPPITEAERIELERIESQMRGLGYSGDDDDDADQDQATRERGRVSDWLHLNSVEYNADLDMILLSSPHLGEIFVIDHSTTTAQAAGHTGGRWGHGGDLLWRWGNPRNYGAGVDADQRLFYQHSPTWLSPAADGSPRVLVFNNGGSRADGDWSSVEELVLPWKRGEGFVHAPGGAFGPVTPVWSYQDREHFFSGFISGAQRLASGNTLICEGAEGRVFEVTPAGDVVWDFLNPFGETDENDLGPKPEAGALFRAEWIPPDHPGLVGHDL